MTSELEQLLATPRPDHMTWLRAQKLLHALHPNHVPAAKATLRRWPLELPRPALDVWKTSHKHLLPLCVEFPETRVYSLYTAAIGTSPLLRFSDGSQAATVWRQQRGTVELASGQRMSFNDEQTGMGDLGVALRVELFHCTVELYCEVEVKLSGKIPPGAVEYQGTSRRALTATEQAQITRQQARLRRGGVYVFADSCDGAVEALVRARDSIIQRVTQDKE
jgi:hypothetical protein